LMQLLFSLLVVALNPLVAEITNIGEAGWWPLTPPCNLFAFSFKNWSSFKLRKFRPLVVCWMLFCLVVLEEVEVSSKC
jgi:hypothetical protein